MTIRLLTSVIALLIGSELAMRPGPEVLSPTSLNDPGATSVKIYTATTHPRVYGKELRFSTMRGDTTTYSRYSVSVLPGHQTGRIDWPENSPVPSKNFAVTKAEPVDVSGLLSSIGGDARTSGEPVSVFIHGYNQSLQQAVFRMAQMATDRGHTRPAVVFAWPSQKAVAGHIADKDSAAYSRDQLVQFIVELAGAPGVGEINVLAHSMGGWLTVEALRQLKLTNRQDVLGRLRVVLASPDIDIDLFRQQMVVIGAMKLPLIVLVAPDDRALLVSDALGRNMIDLVRWT